MTMRTSMVAGNWKMNGSRESVAELLSSIREGAGSINGVEIVVFPPFIFLEQVKQSFSGHTVAWGAQDLNSESDGAYTGEISGSMLVDFGCQYVIVGHSERRHLFSEDDHLVAKKFVRATKLGLKPILCLGETLDERKNGGTREVVFRQLDAVLDLAEGISALKNAILAYEPVWAIGTGETATPDQAQEVHLALRERLAEQDKQIAENVCILYGGSVKSSNANDLFAMPDIDGGLIGGASLDAKEFLEICQCIK